LLLDHKWLKDVEKEIDRAIIPASRFPVVKMMDLLRRCLPFPESG